MLIFFSYIAAFAAGAVTLAWLCYRADQKPEVIENHWDTLPLEQWKQGTMLPLPESFAAMRASPGWANLQTGMNESALTRRSRWLRRVWK